MALRLGSTDSSVARLSRFELPSGYGPISEKSHCSEMIGFVLSYITNAFVSISLIVQGYKPDPTGHIGKVLLFPVLPQHSMALST